MGTDLLIKVPTLIQNFYSNTKFEDIILSSSIYNKTMFIKKNIVDFQVLTFCSSILGNINRIWSLFS